MARVERPRQDWKEIEMRPGITAIALAVLCAVILALGLGGGVMLGRWSAPGERPRIAETATVVTQIQSLSQLVTVRYVFEKVVRLDDLKWDGQNRLLLVAHGIANIQAGEMDRQQMIGRA